jgi:glucose-1-phosphate adenylyltransferase
MGVLALDQDRVSSGEKASSNQERPRLVGVYVFSKRALNRWLSEAQDFRQDASSDARGRARVYGYRFEGYWQDVGTIQSYWEANMALLEDVPSST